MYADRRMGWLYVQTDIACDVKSFVDDLLDSISDDYDYEIPFVLAKVTGCFIFEYR